MTEPLLIAIGDYDHVKDVAAGRVPIPGVNAWFLEMNFEGIVRRFLRFREWDVSEMSLGAYTRLRNSGDDSIVGLPIFLSRVFRQSAFYVKRESDLHELSELRGKRIGIPTWYQTACIFARGILFDDHGIKSSDIEWVQAGVTNSGRRDAFPVTLDGISYEPRPDSTLEKLLAAGEIDVALTARPPRGIGSAFRTVLGDPATAARDYYQRTRILPIMHMLVMTREKYEAHPWIAGNLLDAFEQSKHNSLDRLRNAMLSYVPVPGVSDISGTLLPTQTEDTWPYGLSQNRPTLEAFLRFTREQQITDPSLKLEDLFAPSALEPTEI